MKDLSNINKLSKEDRVYMTRMQAQIASNVLNDELFNASEFFERNRELMIKSDLANLLEKNLIQWVHIDNQYDRVDVVKINIDGEDVVMMQCPLFSMVTYAAFYETLKSEFPEEYGDAKS